MTHVTDAAFAGGPSPEGRSHGRRRVVLIAVAIIAVIAVVLTGGALAYAKQYDGKALPGTTLLGQDISGKTPEQVSALLNDSAQDVTVTVDLDGTKHEASLKDLGVSVDTEATVGRAMSPESSLPAVIGAALNGEHAVTPVVHVDEKTTEAYVQDLIPTSKTKPKNATVSFDEDKGTWTVTPGRDGQGVDPSALVSTVSDEAASLQDFTVTQKVTRIEPKISTQDAKLAVKDASKRLEQPMTISGPDDRTHEISAERRADWIGISPNKKGDALEVTVDADAVHDWVSQRAQSDTVEKKDGIEQVDEDGKVVTTVAEKQDGVEITNVDEVAGQTVTALKKAKSLSTSFTTKTVKATVNKVDAPSDEKSSSDDSDDEDDPTSTDDDKSTAPEKPGQDKPRGEKWIDINLSNKTITAYEGDKVVFGPRTMVDGGKGHETATGSYTIYLRYDKQDMTNAGKYDEDDPRYYYTEDVPYVQYFHGGFAIHGAPWRSSFGYSGSHGCINLPVSDAQWFYEWASIGTRVESHY